MSILLPYETESNIVKNYDIYKYWQLNTDPYTKGIPVAFFTTPILNLTKQNYDLDEYFAYMVNTYPDLYNSLTLADLNNSGTITPSTSPYIKVLFNSFKGLDGKDLSAKTVDIGETFYGYKQTLSGPNIDSVVGDTVSVKYADSKELHIIKLHKLWMDYIEHVSRGKFAPYSEIIKKREIDYVSTLYYFVLDYDYETILYYSRYTGIVPISNPYSSLVASIGDSRDIPDITIEYSYSYKQDLDPSILIDFNRINSTDYISLRDLDNNSKSYNIPIFDVESRSENKNKNCDIYKSIFSGQPKIYKQDTGLSGGIHPTQKYRLMFTTP